MTLFILRMLRSLYRLIISETAPLSIASGFACGLILGFTPLTAPHNMLIVMAILLLRVNLSATLFGMALFKLIGFPLWGAFHELGLSLLTREGSGATWQSIVYAPGLSLLRLNNTQILGSLLVSLLLFPIVTIAGIGLVRRARQLINEKRANHWFVKFVSKSRILAYMSRWA